MNLTEEEKEMAVSSLFMRKNYVETGNVALSANDCVARKMHKEIKALSPDQKAGIAQIEKIIEKLSMIQFDDNHVDSDQAAQDVSDLTDAYAGLAMQGILQYPSIASVFVSDGEKYALLKYEFGKLIANAAYHMADAMIAERGRGRAEERHIEREELKLKPPK
jgi:hypothetical protein